MGTVVTIEVLADSPEVDEAIDGAFEWFQEVERCCTRFNPESDLMRLTKRVGSPVDPGAIVFEALNFALLVAEETNGAFDPTVGHRMEAAGFNREDSTGAEVNSGVPSDDPVTFRDIRVDEKRRTVTLLRPMVLDLSAVAKGMAVDMAARELSLFHDFAIDAGGDLYMGGRNAQRRPWSVGIRHPRQDGAVIETLLLSNQAACTSGDYERDGHILNPQTGDPSTGVASVTVVANGAMLADALATAAFVLEPPEGIAFLKRMDVEGLIITPDLQRFETPGLRRAP